MVGLGCRGESRRRMLVVLPVLISLAGCAAGRTDDAPPRPRQSPSTASVASDPAYRAAEAGFRAGDLRGALRRIEEVQQRPGLSEPDRTFLARQRDIVRRKLGLPVAARASSAPTPRSPGRRDDAHTGSCGPQALAFVCTAMGVKATPEELTAAAGAAGSGTSLAGLARAAARKGLTAEGVQMDLPALKRLDQRAVAWVDGNHFVALLAVNGDTVTIRDPNRDREETVATDDLLRRSGGILLLVRR